MIGGQRDAEPVAGVVVDESRLVAVDNEVDRGETLTIEAPLPADFEQLLAVLREDAP